MDNPRTTLCLLCSVLLQIIQIIHMTLGIIPESDRKGRAVCQSWLQGGKHNVTPTDKNPSDESHPTLIFRLKLLWIKTSGVEFHLLKTTPKYQIKMSLKFNKY